MSEFNEGGLAERTGGTLQGGVTQPGGPNTSSGSYRGGGSGSSSSSGGGAPVSDKYVGPVRIAPYGITPFAVPRKDQTLQDRQWGYLGGGMVGTGFGVGSRYGSSGSSASSGTTQKVWSPTLKKYVPVPKPKPRVVTIVDPITKKPKQVVLPDLSRPPYEVPYQGVYSGYGTYTNPIVTPRSDPLPGSVYSGYGSPFNVPQPATNQGQGWGGLWDDIGNAATGIGGMVRDAAKGWGGMINDSMKGWGGILGRQEGGPVEPGQEYVVGEAGPEILQMNATGGGQVIPNSQTMQTLGGLPGIGNAIGGGRPDRPDRMGGGLQNPGMMDWRADKPVMGNMLKPEWQEALRAWHAAKPRNDRFGMDTSASAATGDVLAGGGDTNMPLPGGNPGNNDWRTAIRNWQAQRPARGSMTQPDWRTAMDTWRGTRPQRGGIGNMMLGG